METKPNYILIGAAIVALAAVALYIEYGPGPHDDLAKCIAGRGVKLYGAFWCSHCEEQKELFGSSEKYLDYVECSTPDGQGTLPACIDAGIESYPTWVLPDGLKLTGVVPLEELAGFSGCSINK